MHLGTASKEHLQYLAQIVADHQDTEPSAGVSRFIRKLSVLEPGPSAAAKAKWHEKESDTIVRRRLSAPLLDARLQELYELDRSAPVALLETRTYLGLLNDLVDDVREYQKMTFGDLGANRTPLEANLRNALSTAGDMALTAIKRMTPLLEPQQRTLPLQLPA